LRRFFTVDIKIPRILNTISNQNQKYENWINKNLYSILTIKEIYVIAYEKMKSKPGNMTKGTDGKTLDAFSIKEIEKLILELKTENINLDRLKEYISLKKMES
jgi:hypothetical protein